MRGNGSDTLGRRFSEPGYCVQSGAQTALNGNDSVCPQTKYGPASGKSNHADEEGDVRETKSEREGKDSGRRTERRAHLGGVPG